MSSRRGPIGERKVVNELRRHHYLVASLRHFKGPGDILALPVLAPGFQKFAQTRPLLIEVKATSDYPWRSTWGPTERGAMMLAADAWGVEPVLAWLPPSLGGIIWLPPTDWPS